MFLITRRIGILGIIIGLVSLSSCNVTKYLADNEKLYDGAAIKVKSVGKVSGKKTVKSELEALLPKTNKKILGMRPKLWAYYKAGPVKKKKGFKHWLRTKVGEPPVLYKDIDTEKIENNMLGILYNKGYFDANVEFEENIKDKKVKLEYTAIVQRPYTIKEVNFPKPSSSFDSQLVVLQKGTILKPGKDYSLQKLEDERDRIDKALKDLGYYYFNSDFLIFRADSTAGERQVNISLEVKPDAPDQGLKPYRLNKVYLNPDFTSSNRTSAELDTVQSENVNFIKRGNGLFRPKSLTRLVFIKEDSLYSRKDHNITLNRLMGMDVFKYVNIRFTDADSASTAKEGSLNAYIQMSPLLKKNLKAEIQGYSKSTNFAGPAVQFSFRNRNALRGAELLQFNLSTSFETQITGNFKNFPAYEVDANTQLFLPRFLTPFNIRNKNSIYVPRTKIQLGYLLQHRFNYYSQRSFNTSFGYQWKETKARDHQLNIINVSYLYFDDKRSDEDKEKARQGFDIFKLKSLQNQFILGGNYLFTYNNLLEKAGNGKTHFYFSGGIDVSGNLAYLLNRTFEKRDASEEPYKIFDQEFAQYLKNDIDFRLYYDFNKTSRLATRLYAGVGNAYGNSKSLPFAKQYYAGGPSGLRAFRARSLGPGTFRDSVAVSSFFTQMGDMKLEGNIEYRFDIISILKGALFVDAGNIWLTSEPDDQAKTGSDENGSKRSVGLFNKKTFLDETAVGAGAGLRIDVSFVVLRLDLAIPMRKFYALQNKKYIPLQGKDRWVVDKIDFSNREWRRDNLVLNIAIGYPF